MNFIKKRPHLIPALIATLMLFGALGRWPYGYYQLLRLVVCGVSFFIVVMAYQWHQSWAIYLFVIIGLLFNPLIPVHLSRDIWQPIDVICALFFIISIFVLKKPSGKTDK